MIVVVVAPPPKLVMAHPVVVYLVTPSSPTVWVTAGRRHVVGAALTAVLAVRSTIVLSRSAMVLCIANRKRVYRGER